MKIKLNWGTGIFITIVMMVLFMSALVYVATRQDFYLVEEDYYEQGVVFQDKIEKRKNTGTLKTKVEIVQKAKEILVVFPSELIGNEIAGTLYFYNPANKSKDFKTDIQLRKDLKQNIKISNLRKGRYIVKIDWKSSGKSYYQEENLMVK